VSHGSRNVPSTRERRRCTNRIQGADQEKSEERPVATVAQVFALADQMPGRFRVFVLAAALTGLRWGELIALRRCDLDLDAPAVYVPEVRAARFRGDRRRADQVACRRTDGCAAGTAPGRPARAPGHPPSVHLTCGGRVRG
jgi:hypothetical protein